MRNKGFHFEYYPRRKSFLRNIHSGFADFILILLAALLIFGFIFYVQHVFSPYQEKVEINLSAWHLPKYTFFSLCRGLLAYLLSLIFALLWGFWVAKDRLAERTVLPILDIMQSIPFLGFLPGVVLLFVHLFQSTNFGLELAAIMIMFTSQVWNMAFGVYHSIRTVPITANEAADIYGFSGWQKVKWVELPFATLSLSWNSIMSMAGCWFLLMVNEAFKLGNRDFQLPGLGSYMSVAANHGDIFAIITAMIAMIVLIILLDQFLWRPLVTWSQKFRIEDTAPSTITETWFLNVLNNSYIIGANRRLGHRFSKEIQNWQASLKTASHHQISKIVSRICIVILFALIIAAVYSVIRLILPVTFDEWKHLGTMLLYTFIRVLICLIISLLIAVPIGLMIGLSEKNLRLFEPLIQIGASFPATLLFPVIVLLMNILGISLAIGSVVLMLMGSFWYVFLNVIAGAKAMPSDLREVAANFQFSTKQTFFWLHLPAIFPYLIVGIMTAAGGAWNASVVSEYVNYRNKVMTTPGIGSAIELAAQHNNMHLLAASILVLSAFVVIINYCVWLRVYHYSEKRFAINN